MPKSEFTKLLFPERTCDKISARGPARPLTYKWKRRRGEDEQQELGGEDECVLGVKKRKLGLLNENEFQITQTGYIFIWTWTGGWGLVFWLEKGKPNEWKCQVPELWIIYNWLFCFLSVYISSFGPKRPHFFSWFRDEELAWLSY